MEHVYFKFLICLNRPSFSNVQIYIYTWSHMKNCIWYVHIYDWCRNCRPWNLSGLYKKAKPVAYISPFFEDWHPKQPLKKSKHDGISIGRFKNSQRDTNKGTKEATSTLGLIYPLEVFVVRPWKMTSRPQFRKVRTEKKTSLFQEAM